jgi:hypothetical protein
VTLVQPLTNTTPRRASPRARRLIVQFRCMINRHHQPVHRQRRIQKGVDELILSRPMASGRFFIDLFTGGSISPREV